MDNKEILKVAIEQSARDYGIRYQDFVTNGFKIFESKSPSNNARNYLTQEPYLNFIYYGSSLVAIANEAIRDFVEKYINSNKSELFRVFDAPQLIVLNNELEKHNKCIAHLAQFYLPDTEYKPKLNTSIKTKLYVGDELIELYDDDRFNMALCYSRSNKRRDEIALVGFVDDKIVGVAGASNDCNTMWQIGIDVIPQYRKQGIASTLTYLLSKKILEMGIVPFYCCAWSNIASKTTARKSGFKDAWVELTAKDITEEWISKIRNIRE